ncbi:MAG: membrane protein insertase YidC [Gammaproteobacteria bacterium]|nr:membrane protein insertase YidC [Gammaproteobacteria bacterium]
MDNRRLFLFAALIMVAFLIYQAWMQDYGPKPPPPTAQTSTATAAAAAASAAVPEIPAAPGSASVAIAPAVKPAVTPTPQVSAAPVGEPIEVRTDLLDVTINTAGGALQRAELRDYPEELHKPARVKVLDSEPADLMVAQSGLQTHSGPVAPSDTALYTASQTQYQLPLGQDSLAVTLSWKSPTGLTVDKIYTFHRGSYQVDLRYEVHNASTQAWSGAAYAQFESRYNVDLPHGFFASMFSVHRYDYQRMALDGSGGYQQYEFKDVADKPVNVTSTGGWTSVVTLYFLSAVIPGDQNASNLYYARSLGDGRYLVGTIGALKTVAAGASASFADKFYLGPKLQTLLPQVAPGLQLTVDYGKFTIIAEPLFKLLNFLHRLVGNWGWAIILLTVLVKLVFFPLNQVAFRSMAKMRAAQPRIKALQERYKDEKQKLAQAQMEFYKKEKINPLGGCLPMIIQLPIFFALYYVLVYSVELRQQPWILWIHDLSAPDPYFILPILYGLVLLVQYHIQPQMTTDRTQQRIMKFAPAIFAVFYAVFPSGLVLYYFPNSILTIGQQWWINRRYDVEGKRHQKDKALKPKK